MALNFWDGFGDTSGFIEVDCEFNGSMATAAMEEFGVPVATPGIGGNLQDLDIKHMDALTVARMSLLHYSAQHGGKYEAIVNPDGEVEFKNIGTYPANLGNYYYEVQSSSFVENCSGVLVTGKTPLTTRPDPNWTPIWGDSKYIFDTSQMYSNCMKDNFCQYCTIVFNDPHLDSAFEDGIDNLYEINRNNPWDSIIGYAYYKNPPEQLVTDDTDIKYSETSTIPILLGNIDTGIDLGILRPKPITYDTADEDCLYKYNEQASGGVEVIMPEQLRYESIRGDRVDKFIQLSQVYMVGMEIDYYQSVPKNPSDAKDVPTPDNTILKISINDFEKKVFRLSVGTDYAQVIEGEGYDKTVKVAFSDNSSVYDHFIYGNGKDGSNAEYVVIPECAWYVVEQIGTGVIFPRSDTKAILVYEVWVAAELETPSISVYDPDGTGCRAVAIAENLEYDIAPLISVDKPAPIGFNGRLVNQIDGIQDHDPTTSQAFQDTDLEGIMDTMDGGGGLTLSLSFLEEDDVVQLSEVLYDYMNSGDGIETTYICPPDADPQLGGLSTAGIINSINYSYSDQGSYTISATAGPRLVGGLSQVDGGPSFKMTEEVSARGTVIQDMGNHVYFKVRIEGYGERIAICTCADVIRVGDKVNCTVHNNPVES